MLDEPAQAPVASAADRTIDVTVHDTVQHCQFFWSVASDASDTPVAKVACMSRQLRRVADSQAAHNSEQQPWTSPCDQGAVTIVPLGERTVQGFRTFGTRTVHTCRTSAGMQDRLTEDRWWSPDLYAILEGTVTESHGTVTSRVTAIRRDDPGPDLFFPPAGTPIHSDTGTPNDSISVPTRW